MSLSSSNFRRITIYNGPVRACIFDWAGTVCDSGVYAPVLTFQKLFRDEGIEITSEEVRAPMGVHKRVHIQKICETPSVAERWKAKKRGKLPTTDDVERIYRKSLISILDILPANSRMITGAVDAINALRQKYRIKIGSSTGYTKEIMEKLKVLASEEGYTPDAYVTSDEVITARPSPSMIYLNMIRLDVWPTSAVVKIDDTIGGIEAGIAAGCWTVGIAKTGNYVGATEEELANMDPEELKTKVEEAKKKLFGAGAHFVVDTIVDLPDVIQGINKRLELGIGP